jgi:hypothetical protein
VKADPKLLQVVGALGSARGLSSCLDGGQQERDEHTDDGDDDEELDQSKAPARTQTHGKSSRESWWGNQPESSTKWKRTTELDKDEENVAIGEESL